ncbi:MAG: CHASE3 domain-containing protein [Taibaiella sp.]|nr:CHASE3 domain-containing protein [Taibaiella sp.]
MKKRTLFIAIAFCISFFIMGGFAVFSIHKLNRFIEYSNLMDYSGFVIEKIYSAEKSLRDIDRTERGYMITKDAMFLRYLNNSIDSLHSHVSALKKITGDDAQLQRDITLLNGSIANRVHALRENIDYVDTCTSSRLSKYYYDSRELMLDCSKTLKKIHDAENTLKDKRYRDEREYEKIAARLVISMVIAFTLISLFLFAMLLKELNGRVRYQEELQARIIDLQHSHEELQEIAFVASHDLQEPLRKIQVFSNMLVYLKDDQIGEKHRGNLERINKSARRMQSLITDLMSLTSLTKTSEDMRLIDLNRMFHYILGEMSEVVTEKDAVIEVKLLPGITGIDKQIKILLTALIDNALKFNRPGVKPVITVTNAVMMGHELNDININLKHKKFNCISISDNGIGFEKQFMSKMFHIFQRLHHENAGYEGKGIGLAICRRIMANHDGYIIATGIPGMGATFKLFFPYES